MSLDICPHCNEDIDTVYEEYAGSGMDDLFDMNCPCCGKLIEVSVWVQEPNFDLREKGE
jgi:uncharacterized protein (UPF0212 family)